MRETFHVLIVDDNLDICDLVKEFLCEAGYRVSIAYSGADMRRVLEQSMVDLVLVDFLLPKDEGSSLARSLRAEHPDLGIIIMTGADKDIGQMAGEVGADDALAKPFRLRELRARIESVRRRARELD